MTRIDFYILQKSDNQKSYFDFSCRLIEKAMRQGNRILVHTDSLEDSEIFDELLWSYKPESYLPHAIEGTLDASENDLPVLISHEHIPQQHNDVLLNMSASIPDQFARFSRFAQVVNQTPARLESSRRHFAFFKERGYPIEVNKLNR